MSSESQQQTLSELEFNFPAEAWETHQEKYIKSNLFQTREEAFELLYSIENYYGASNAHQKIIWVGLSYTHNNMYRVLIHSENFMSQINFRHSLTQGFTAHDPGNFEEINHYLFDLNMFSQILPGVTEQLEWSITNDGMYYFLEITASPNADNPNVNQHLASIRNLTSNFLLVYLQKILIDDEMIPHDCPIAQIYNAAIDRIRNLVTAYAPSYVVIEKAALVAEDNRLSEELSQFYQEQEEQQEEPTAPTFGLMLSSSSE